MARRRKVTAPSADDLTRIEEEFRRETSQRPAMGIAPISHVTAEAAQALEIHSPEIRVEQVKNKSDAEAHQQALRQGRIIQEIPLDQIMDDAMVRDRMVLDQAEMSELKLSISANGLRLPVEVFERAPDGSGDRPYGLLSGYRRLRAFRDLLALTGDKKYDSIKVLVRDPNDLGGAFSAMVEENEIRSTLSHFERGRIAVIAAQQGVFSNTEEAVADLFSAASKAKRSKIRSFSLIFEELGDMLQFPENLKERDGLRLATAIRNGAETQLREALATGQGTSADLEWAVLEQVIEGSEREAQPNNKGGRPTVRVPTKGWRGPDILHLSSGVTLQRLEDSRGHLIRVTGQGVDAALIEKAMEQLQYLFEKE